METLLGGKTGYSTRKFIRAAFPEESVVVLGDPRLKTSKKNQITSYPVKLEDSRAGDVIDGYRFERVVYFSNYLTLHGEREGELEQIRKTLRRCG